MNCEAVGLHTPTQIRHRRTLTVPVSPRRFFLMNITLKPETERLIQEELQSGHFHSVDEIIVQGVQARRENNTAPQGRLLNTGRQRKTKAEAAEHIRRMRRGNRLPAGMTIRDLINEGRA